MIDVFFTGNVTGIFRQRLALFEDEPDLLRGPKLGEKFLPVMLHQLHGRFVEDQSFTRQGKEKRATGLALFRAGFLGLLGVHIHQVIGASGQ